MSLTRLIAFSVLYYAVISTESMAQHTRQTVVVHNIKNKKGKLMIGWYNSEASYQDKKNPVFKKIVEVNQPSEMSIPFDNIPVGNYAISIYLDENGNNKMDINFLGIPKETYGFSNNIIPATRAASYDEAAFEVKNKSGEIPIRLK